jgi:hypothetical protein
VSGRTDHAFIAACCTLWSCSRNGEHWRDFFLNLFRTWRSARSWLIRRLVSWEEFERAVGRTAGSSAAPSKNKLQPPDSIRKSMETPVGMTRRELGGPRRSC